MAVKLHTRLPDLQVLIDRWKRSNYKWFLIGIKTFSKKEIASSTGC